MANADSLRWWWRTSWSALVVVVGGAMEQVVQTCGGAEVGAQRDALGVDGRSLLRQHRALIQTLRDRTSIAVCSAIHDRRVWYVECRGDVLKGLDGADMVFADIHAATAYALEVVKQFDLDHRAHAS